MLEASRGPTLGGGMDNDGVFSNMSSGNAPGDDIEASPQPTRSEEERPLKDEPPPYASESYRLPLYSSDAVHPPEGPLCISFKPFSLGLFLGLVPYIGIAAVLVRSDSESARLGALVGFALMVLLHGSIDYSYARAALEKTHPTTSALPVLRYAFDIALIALGATLCCAIIGIVTHVVRERLWRKHVQYVPLADEDADPALAAQRRMARWEEARRRERELLRSLQRAGLV